jgi:hypothetical protein
MSIKNEEIEQFHPDGAVPTLSQKMNQYWSAHDEA